MKREDIPGMELYPDMGFTFKDIPYEDSPDWKYYLLCGSNRLKAGTDILKLNGYMDIAQKFCPSIGPNRIVAEKFVYSRQRNDLNNFIFLRATPFTPTGKPSKFPLILYFNHQMLPIATENTDQVFGEIQYLKNGVIGAAKIIQWYAGRLKIISLAQKDNELVVTSVEASENGVRTKIYKR